MGKKIAFLTLIYGLLFLAIPFAFRKEFNGDIITPDGLLGYLGAFLSCLITVLAVLWQINENNKKTKEENEKVEKEKLLNIKKYLHYYLSKYINRYEFDNIDESISFLALDRKNKTYKDELFEEIDSDFISKNLESILSIKDGYKILELFQELKKAKTLYEEKMLELDLYEWSENLNYSFSRTKNLYKYDSSIYKLLLTCNSILLTLVEKNTTIEWKQKKLNDLDDIISEILLTKPSHSFLNKEKIEIRNRVLNDNNTFFSTCNIYLSLLNKTSIIIDSCTGGLNLNMYKESNVSKFLTILNNEIIYFQQFYNSLNLINTLISEIIPILNSLDID